MAADEYGKTSPPYYDRAEAMVEFHQAYDRSL